jgi:hypothetical protein
MAHAEAGERRSLIAGLRALATFLEDHPDVPSPRWADVMVFPADCTDHEAQVEVDTIAALIGSDVHDETANQGHYTTSRGFGPVEYRAVAIPTGDRGSSQGQPTKRNDA